MIMVHVLPIQGCTNSFALNYDSNANTDNGSCCYIEGCMMWKLLTYGSSACFDDESCISAVEGCTDPTAFNYDASANTDNDSCIPFVYGCTDDTTALITTLMQILILMVCYVFHLFQAVHKC